MNNNIAIKVHNLHKSFNLPENRITSIKQLFVNFGKNRKKSRQKVLDGIDFEVNEGDFFGIVGRNGSGKSTLLKVIAGVYSPDSGAVEVKGNLTPFIELGVGFNPELSGRDNVYLNASLLGYTRRQVDAMYDEIVGFAELEEHMDKKLKNYSSGMQVRLAFSIAIKAKNDVLIFDEVLAVGDEAFQRKCYDIFEQYKADKQTIILVTHDMETVRKFCNRAMLINDGKITEIGNPRRVSEKYSKLNTDVINKGTERKNSKQKENKHLKVKILNDKSQPINNFELGSTLLAELRWEGLPAGKIESIGVNVFKLSGEHITGINTRDSAHSKDWKKRGQIGIKFDLNFTPGSYYLLVEVFESPGKVIESVLNGLQFNINKCTTPLHWSGLIELPYKWHE